MVRTNQGGSILGFIILGVAMAILLIGGAYAIRHNFFPPETGPQAVTSGENDKPSEQTPDNNQAAPAPNTDQKDEANNPRQQPVLNDSDDSADKKEVAPPAPITSDSPSNGLPETGPSDLFFASLMLSGLAALLVGYAQSRRPSASL